MTYVAYNIPTNNNILYGEDFAIVSPITRKHFIDKEKKKKQRKCGR